MQRKQVFALAPAVLCLFLSASGMANGDFSLKTIASFSGPDGSNPFGGVTVDSRGNLYGTTYSGGAKNDGTVYKIAAGTGTLSTIASFNLANGAFPYAGLTLDAHGNLFGTTSGGGPEDAGTVFELVNNAVVPEPASIVDLGQAATLLGIALAVRARARRVR